MNDNSYRFQLEALRRDMEEQDARWCEIRDGLARVPSIFHVKAGSFPPHHRREAPTPGLRG